MATSWVEVCNLALTALGSQPITAFPPTDDSQAAKLAQACYQMLADEVLSAADFACAETRQALNADTTAPEDPEWTYQFQLPIDCLHVRGVSPATDYVRSGNMLLCNEVSITLVYTRKLTDPTLLDSHVGSAIAARIAMHLAPKIVQKMDFTRMMIAAYDRALLEARMADAKGKRKVSGSGRTANVLLDQRVEEIG
jgi:hypothetical protein